nr:hypothetical protein HmN_000502200 [Hymenolepis microstoma]CUU98384.1 hypothetical transcript [Hymenolepis microstoma]
MAIAFSYQQIINERYHSLLLQPRFPQPIEVMGFCKTAALLQSDIEDSEDPSDVDSTQGDSQKLACQLIDLRDKLILLLQGVN